MRRTKIVCTIGPSSSKRTVIERMLRAGMNVARLNFSHGTHDSHAESIHNLRDLSHKMGIPLAILQDLSGPKVRIGSLPVPVLMLKRGQVVGFCASESVQYNNECPLIPLPVPELLAALHKGNTLLIDDGTIQMRVVGRDGDSSDPESIVWARCTTNGALKPHKGVTALGLSFAVPAVTVKDLEDLRFGLSNGVDWVAASYVRSAEDITPLRKTMIEQGISAPIIAKIEKFEAVRNIESIIAAVDGIMVARGDLGVETPFDEVPIIQKRIILLANRAGKPVITATQMLESMISCPRPTRAEATDVANAILDGTDAVMLSGETASGQYPVETISTMAKIAVKAEAAFFDSISYAHRLTAPNSVTEAVAKAAGQIAEQIRADAILCATTSGSTALRVAQQRPKVRIVAATESAETYRRLALSWGVTAVMIHAVKSTDDMFATTLEAAEKNRLIQKGNTVVLTAGVPVNNPGTTNLIKVHVVGAPF